MNRTPEKSTCKLLDGIANPDVSNLKEKEGLSLCQVGYWYGMTLIPDFAHSPVMAGGGSDIHTRGDADERTNDLTLLARSKY